MWRAIYSTMKKNKKIKVVYKEDTGETVYSMAALEGKTPEELEQRDKERKNRVKITRKERFAMIRAAFEVYGPRILILVMSFTLVALLLYLLLI